MFSFRNLKMNFNRSISYFSGGKNINIAETVQNPDVMNNKHMKSLKHIKSCSYAVVPIFGLRMYVS